MNPIKHIPNAMTCGNLVCGCLGLLFCAAFRLDLAFYMIVIAAVLDFFDGFTARLLKVSSPIGKDLDSLADMVTFGVLPGFVMYKMIGLVVLDFKIPVAIEAYSLFHMEAASGIMQNRDGHELMTYIPFLAFLIPVFSAIRLAKFNNDKRQSNSFIGVPTPANALLIGSLGFLLIQQLRHEGEADNNYFLMYNMFSLIAMTVTMSYLLIAEIPLFALKFNNFRWRNNRTRYTFLISSFALLILFQFTAFPFIIFLYIVLSIFSNVIHGIRIRKELKAEEGH